MGPLFEEHLVSQGTLVKPYYWLSSSPDCAHCPYHIRTGEEARIPAAEFYQLFGISCHPRQPPHRHLTFYELKTPTGCLLQKGQASGCTKCSTHPEEMLFEAGGYLDRARHRDGGLGQVILYSSLSPCNEAGHHCISKMYAFLARHPGVVLRVHLAQLYHTETHFPTAAWNREALRSLASLWPRVAVSPISGGLWHTLFHDFVNGTLGPTDLQQVLAWRALVDMQLADDIYAIIGPQPRGADVHPLKDAAEPRDGQVAQDAPECFQVLPANRTFPQSTLAPNLGVPVIFVLVPHRDLPPIEMNPFSLRPRNVVRHLNLPQLPILESMVTSRALPEQSARSGETEAGIKICSEPERDCSRYSAC